MQINGAVKVTGKGNVIIKKDHKMKTAGSICNVSMSDNLDDGVAWA